MNEFFLTCVKHLSPWETTCLNEDLNSWTSEVRRDTISPDLWLSKNSISCFNIEANKSFLIAAATFSPLGKKVFIQFRYKFSMINTWEVELWISESKQPMMEKTLTHFCESIDICKGQNSMRYIIFDDVAYRFFNLVHEISGGFISNTRSWQIGRKNVDQASYSDPDFCIPIK